MKLNFDIQKKLSILLLKKTVGPFIKSDLNSLSIQLLSTNGRFQLSDLQLNVEKINEMLEGLPFKLNEVYIGEISTLWDLKNFNISVKLKDINIIILVEDKELDEEIFYDVVENFMIPSSLNVASEFVEQEYPEDISDDSNESEEPKSIVQRFSSIIDKIIEKLMISIENLKIRVLFNIDKNKDNYSNSATKDKDIQKCGLDIVIPNVKFAEGSMTNEKGEKINANIIKDLIFNELSIYLNYYEDDNEHQNSLNTNTNKDVLLDSVISYQDFGSSIFYDACDSLNNNDENSEPYNIKNLKTKIDKNISKSYCILSCSKNSENIIHIIQSSDSVITNGRRNSINEDKSNTSFEMKFNEWTINATFQNICLFLIPKNIETILLFSSNLIPSLSSSNDININKSINDNQEISILDDSSYPTQMNKLSKRSSSQSLQINKKPPQSNSIFTFKCSLNHCLGFIINDDEEKFCLPYFDYDVFMERNFDKSIDCNDTFRKSLGEMLNEYHIKIDIRDLYFQTSNKSEFYYSSIVNEEIKNSKDTDLKQVFLMKSISLSEWINGSYNDILCSHENSPNYNYYMKIVDSDVVNNNEHQNNKPTLNVLEYYAYSNKLETDISNLHINFSYKVYQRIEAFIWKIMNKSYNILKENFLSQTNSDSSSNYDYDIQDDISDGDNSNYEIDIRFNDIQSKLILDEINNDSKYNGILIDLISGQFKMADDIQFQINKFGISLISNELEEIQTEPVLFITSSKENYFFSLITNQDILENNVPKAFLNKFLNNISSGDYGKFSFKEKSLQQFKYQMDVNISDLFVNIDPNIVKGIMHMINYVLDEFVNNDNSITEKASSSPIQEYKEKNFELTSLNIKINNVKILLFGLEDICYQLTLEKFDTFMAFSNLGPYYIYIKNELFSFYENNLNSSVSFPLIQNNPFQNLEDMIEVSIYPLGNEETVKNLSVLKINIALSNMLFNIDIPRLFQLSTISEVFNDLPAIHSTSDEPMALNFSLAFNNLLLGYEKLEKFSPQFIIRFDNINIYSVDTFIMGDILSLNLNLSISKVNALLTNQCSLPLETQDMTFDDSSLLDYLKHIGYANMLSIDILVVNININDSKLMINLSKEKSNIYFDMCSDSVATLYQIIENALLLIPQGETKASDIEFPISQEVNSIINEDAHTQEINRIIDEDAYIQEINRIIDEDAYFQEVNIDEERKSNSIAYDEDEKDDDIYKEDDDICIINNEQVQNIPHYDYPKNNTPYETKDKVISYSNDFKLNNNFLEDIYNKMKLKSKKPKLKFPNPIMNINVKNINFYIRIFNGNDWKATSPSDVQISKTSTEYMSRSKESIDIEIKEIYYDYSVYSKNSYYANKLNLVINEFQIINKIIGDHQFLTYQDPIEPPMFKFKILNIKPIPSDPTLESIVNFYVSPLKFYVDQDTLFKFIEILSCFNSDTKSENRASTSIPSTSSSNKMTSSKQTISADDSIKKKDSNKTYFRKVNISDIRIIVSYKAKEFNIGNLRNGQYKEVMNVTSLIGATLNFESLQFSGVSGVDGIIQRVKEKYLPMAIKQVSSIVFYSEHFYPYFKIGQSVIDSFKNIYQSYRDGEVDGESVMSVIKGGAKDVILITIIEYLKLISRVFSKAHDFFEKAERKSSTPKLNNKGKSRENTYDDEKEEASFINDKRPENSEKGKIRKTVSGFLKNLTKAASKTTINISKALDTKNKMENQQVIID